MVPLGSYEEDLYVCVFPPVPIFEGPVIAGIGGRFAFLVVVTESEKWEKFCFSLGILRVF